MAGQQAKLACSVDTSKVHLLPQTNGPAEWSYALLLCPIAHSQRLGQLSAAISLRTTYQQSVR